MHRRHRSPTAARATVPELPAPTACTAAAGRGLGVHAGLLQLAPTDVDGRARPGRSYVHRLERKTLALVLLVYVVACVRVRRLCPSISTPNLKEAPARVDHDAYTGTGAGCRILMFEFLIARAIGIANSY